MVDVHFETCTNSSIRGKSSQERILCSTLFSSVTTGLGFKILKIHFMISQTVISAIFTNIIGFSN